MITSLINELLTIFTIIVSDYAMVLTLALALLLDKMLGEAKHWHYLVAFGRLANKLEQKLNPNSDNLTAQLTAGQVKLRGALAWCLLVLPIPILYSLYLSNLPLYWQILLDASMLYLAIGLTSLKQHALQIYQPLRSGDLATARKFTGYIVSRDTQNLTEQEMSRATVESMLENGHDAVIASLFYFIIGGAPLVLLHRFANTLDAMWGYKTTRFNNFGFASAKLDDLLGFCSAKIITLLYALQGLPKGLFWSALINAYQQGNQYKSHNGGWVMAAGASVIKVKLGGNAQYHGEQKQSVLLGTGDSVTIASIKSSLQLVNRASILLLFLAVSLQHLLLITTT